jgi:hypothetical protein
MTELLVRPKEVSISEWKKMTEEEKRCSMLLHFRKSSTTSFLKSAWSVVSTQEKR